MSSTTELSNSTKRLLQAIRIFMMIKLIRFVLFLIQKTIKYTPQVVSGFLGVVTLIRKTNCYCTILGCAVKDTILCACEWVTVYGKNIFNYTFTNIFYYTVNNTFKLLKKSKTIFHSILIHTNNILHKTNLLTNLLTNLIVFISYGFTTLKCYLKSLARRYFRIVILLLLRSMSEKEIENLARDVISINEEIV